MLAVAALVVVVVVLDVAGVLRCRMDFVGEYI